MNEKTDHIRMRYPIKMSHSPANDIRDLCNRVDRAEARAQELEEVLRDIAVFATETSGAAEEDLASCVKLATDALKRAPNESEEK